MIIGNGHVSGCEPTRLRAFSGGEVGLDRISGISVIRPYGLTSLAKPQDPTVLDEFWIYHLPSWWGRPSLGGLGCEVRHVR